MENKELQQNITSVDQEQEIDLIELVQKVWNKRKLVFKAVGVAILLGLIIAFSIPREYTTTVQLAPEVTDGSSKMGSLSGLAAMAGVNLGGASGADAISLDLYPDVVKSTPFLLELFEIPVSIENKKGISLYEYMTEYQKGPWWGPIFSAPFDLLGWVRKLISGKEDLDINFAGSDQKYYYLTIEQEEVIKVLQERISVVIDKKTQVITVGVQMQDPIISAEIVGVVLDKLQEYITAYRTQKVKQDLEFTEVVFEEAKAKYYKAQSMYALFEDANRNIVSASYRTEKERLQNEMNLAYSVYNTLAQQLEQDRLRVQERTPVYTVIEPAKVPLRPSSPRKVLILIGFVFLAGIGSVGYILFGDIFKSTFSSTKEEEEK